MFKSNAVPRFLGLVFCRWLVIDLQADNRLLLPVAILWKITGIGSLVTNTSSSFSELDTNVLSVMRRKEVLLSEADFYKSNVQKN